MKSEYFLLEIPTTVLKGQTQVILKKWSKKIPALVIQAASGSSLNEGV